MFQQLIIVILEKYNWIRGKTYIGFTQELPN